MTRLLGVALLCFGAFVATGSCPSAEDRASGVLESLVRDGEGGVAKFWRNRTQGPYMWKGEGRSYRWLLNFDDLSSIINPNEAHPDRLRRKEVMTYEDAVVMLRWSKEKGKILHPLVDTGGKVDGTKVKELYDEGWSILLKKTMRYFRNVFHFASMTEQAVQFPVSQNIFITPPNSQAFDFHYDSDGAWQLQIRGSKRWSVFPPLVEDPSNTLDDADRIEEQDAPARITGAKQEFLLNEGDVLWVPRGWYHRGTAEGDAGSVHLSTAPQKLMWAEIFQKLGLFHESLLEKHASRAEAAATGDGLPLPLRREVPIRLSHVSVADFRKALLAVAKELGMPQAWRGWKIPEHVLVGFLNDFVAGLAEEVLPPPGMYTSDALEGLSEKRSKNELEALNVQLTTPLRITSTLAARIVSPGAPGSSQQFCWLKYSTANSPHRYKNKSKPLKLPLEASSALRKILHVEENPSGRFTPADISGVNEEEQVKIALKLIRARIAVPEDEWHGLAGGFVPLLPPAFIPSAEDACVPRAERSEL